MSRKKAFHPVCSELEGRVLLSGASLHSVRAMWITETVSAKSRSLQLNGVSPYGFPFRGKTVPPGYQINFIDLGGPSQNLTANGVKVPNSVSNVVEGAPAAVYEPGKIEFFGPSTMHLTTRKGNLTLELNPVTPGSNVVRFTVTSGTGVFATSHGTGTITFGKLAKFHSNR